MTNKQLLLLLFQFRSEHSNAAGYGNVERLKQLFDAGVNPNCRLHWVSDAFELGHLHTNDILSK